MKILLHSSKTWLYISLVATTALAAFGTMSCTDKVVTTMQYTIMEPVYMSIDQLRASLDVEPPKSIENPGNIYLYKNYIFVNEPGKGIHVIDDSDPTNPNPISFIALPGNYNMAIRGDVLYADSYIDLVALDISDPKDVNEINRIESIFTPLLSDVMFDPEKGVVVDWKPKEVVEKSASDFNNGFPMYYQNGSGYAFMTDALSSSALPPVAAQPATGVGGSMARFTITNQHLYAIDNHRMQVFDISNLTAPTTGRAHRNFPRH